MKLKNLIDVQNNALGELEISGITCNSSRVEKGYLFICLKGFSADGHNFAEAAIKNGAAAVICERDLGIKNQIIVEDSHEEYFNISARWFSNPAKKLKLIGVTGTNGKTSITYMLRAILEQAGYKTGVVGTIQNLIGNEIIPTNNTTPDAYELNALFADMCEKGVEYVIMEVSSHALDQKRICNVEFEAALFTNLTQDHLDYHKTMENYFEAKLRLFQMCKTAIINLDDEYGRKLAEKTNCEKITYSVSENSATYTAKEITYKPSGIKYQMVGFNFISPIEVATGGKFTVYNSICAAACAIRLGISKEAIAMALKDMRGVSGRAESVPTNEDFTVIIDYAHTPDGLQNILMTFREYRDHRLVAVFGCGGDRDKTKRPIMGGIAAHLADYVIVTSDNPRTEEPSEIIKDILSGMKGISTPCKVIENRAEAIKFAIENARTNDIIVLAGKGHETYQILKNGKIHFDEREIVAEALKNRSV